MTRLRARINYQTGRLNLQEPPTIAPAVANLAGVASQIAQDVQGKRELKRASLDAQAFEFSRDENGRLLAPEIPVSDSGKIIPSLYDEAYSEQILNRYAQRMELDGRKALADLSIQHRFDPDRFNASADAYRNAIDEIAHPIYRGAINDALFSVQVNHSNHIATLRAERDHREARGMQLQTIQSLNDELHGYVESHASSEVIAAAMLKVKAAIEYGDEFNYWLDDEKAAMHNSVDQGYALTTVIAELNAVADDPLAYAEAIEKMTELSQGKGKINSIDESGNVVSLDASEIFPNPEDRQAIANHAISLLQQRAAAFGNLQDQRLRTDKIAFYDWWHRHSMWAATTGQPIDRNRLFAEFDKADRNVKEFGYDDQLRSEIHAIIMDQITSGPAASQEEQDFLAGFGPWAKRFEAEINKQIGDANREDLSDEKMSEIVFNAWTTAGNVPGGNKQGPQGKRFIGKYYSTFTNREESQEWYEDMIADPDHPNWDQFASDVKLMGMFGIWSEQMSNALVGKLNAPESFDTNTLDGAFRMARMLWDQPTFANNMLDVDALGPAVGGMLNHVFMWGGKRDPATISEHLENYGRPGYAPLENWNALDSEQKDELLAKADKAINRYFTSNWRTLWESTGVQVSGLGIDVFGEEVAIPQAVRNEIKKNIMNNAGFIDPNNERTFDPFIHRSVDDAMHNHGYAPTKMGYSEYRHGNQWNSSFFQPLRGFRKPETAVEQFPPEYFIAKMSRNQTVDPRTVELVWDDFQAVLDEYGKKMGETFKVDENAALVYAGRASDWFNEPTWQIKLLRSDAKTTWLTEDGTPHGRPFRFLIRDAVRRRNEEKEAEHRRNQEINASVRSQFQTGIPTPYLNTSLYQVPQRER